MEQNSVTIRTAEASDRKGIFNLLESAYQCVWDEAYIEWKYDKCPFGKVVTWIAESKGEIIGMRSMRPLVMERNGIERRVALLFDLAVHASFRRKGIFSRLVDFGTKWTSDHGYEMSITFPNKRSSGEYHKRDNWFGIGTLNLIFKPLDLTQVVRKKIGSIPGRILALPLNLIQHFRFSEKDSRNCEDVHIENVSRYPAGIGEVFYGITDRFRIKRNKPYLDWRYCENPRISYINLAAFRRGMPCGFAAGIVREVMGLRLGLIADIAGEYQVLDRLVFEMCRIFRSDKVDMVGLSVSGNNPVYEHLIHKVKFVSLPEMISPKSFLVFACFHSPFSDVPALKEFGNWFTVWGDTDVLEGAGVSL